MNGNSGIRFNSWCRSVALVIIVGSFASCSLSSGGTVRTESHARPSVSVDPYQIGTGDELEVVVWKQPTLSGKVTVSPDGTVTIPLVGHVPAAGRTADQLQAELRDRLGHFVKDPNVMVRVADEHSMIFYVVGEVHRPGVFTLHSGEVLSQAIAEAGGFSDFADASKIRIVRRSPIEVTKVTVDYRRILNGHDLDADMQLQRGDTVFVP